jgi:hypothetical protein
MLHSLLCDACAVVVLVGEERYSSPGNMIVPAVHTDVHCMYVNVVHVTGLRPEEYSNNKSLLYNMYSDIHGWYSQVYGRIFIPCGMNI